jgi:hypothetical protein
VWLEKLGGQRIYIKDSCLRANGSSRVRDISPEIAGIWSLWIGTAKEIHGTRELLMSG